MDIADQVDQPLQRDAAALGVKALLRELGAEVVDLRDDASALRAVARLDVGAGADLDVDEMPARSLGALATDAVGPI